MDTLGEVSKGKVLLDLVMKNSKEKKVIFTQYVKSLEYITDLFNRNGIQHVIFKGALATREKNADGSSNNKRRFQRSIALP